MHRFGDSDPWQQLRALELYASAPGQLMMVVDRMAIQDTDGARGWGIQPLDAIQQGRLARSVGADESEDLPLSHLEGDIVNGGQVSEPSCYSLACYDAHG